MKARGHRLFALAAVASTAALPVNVFAASVVINELAWMGTAASANHEWIELHNAGTESADLTGWVLTASDGTPSISLKGSVAAGGFFLLERTSDETVPGVAADQLYTGTLGNAGETLLLKNASGEAVETVVGGENWTAIGGDNETKETAQRMGSGWVTATGTPRAATAPASPSLGGTATSSDAIVQVPSSTPSVFVPSGAGGGGASSVMELSIRVRASVPLKGIAGADALFSGEAFGLKNEPLQNTRFRWSFGDGGSAEGKKVFHAYHYPGVYAVVISSRFRRTR
jgi:hypothetical protein